MNRLRMDLWLTRTQLMHKKSPTETGHVDWRDARNHGSSVLSQCIWSHLLMLLMSELQITWKFSLDDTCDCLFPTHHARGPCTWKKIFRKIHMYSHQYIYYMYVCMYIYTYIYISVLLFIYHIQCGPSFHPIPGTLWAMDSLIRCLIVI